MKGRRCFSDRLRQRRLCGFCCILLAVLVLVCFVPAWLFAVVVAAALFAVGVALLGGFRC